MQNPKNAHIVSNQTKSIWGRVCRFSIYVTVLGVTLSIIRYKMAINVAKLGGDSIQQAEQIDGLQLYVETYLNTFYYLCAFSFLGFTTFLVSLIMLMRESR